MSAASDARPEAADEDLDGLRRAWRPPAGLRRLSEVNNTYVGLLYIATAILFLVLGGILALIIRAQLAVPNAGLVDEATYNQIFTMHGTVMMFLFAVPMIEAMAVYLMPNMLGARDLPFPRLSAYAYWAYAIGGLVFFGTLFFGVAPDGGWFMYPPLTSYRFSPGINADFWLLGIGFIEISAIAGAIELMVGILRTRAPGMTLSRMPIYAWAMLVVGAMIIFGFPSVILATALLELERAFHWPFFIAERGGDPVLWQHLFWLFGHPEVYIIFLPAAGMVSVMLPALCRTPLVGYHWVVLALLGTGFLSFLLWVHHMFTTGIPMMSLGFFSAASMAVAVPSGIQVFAWLATLWNGRPGVRVPLLFLLGFLFIFTLGGLTGVMVAAVPFDWQVHDSYFVVAHFHYVLIGGMVFPLFAAFYYWAPLVSGRALSERIGRWVFGLMFVGFNVAFFPMHFTGLMGMPRRVYTYPSGLGWDGLNLLATVGTAILAAGIALFLYQFARELRFRHESTANPWGAGTLEWLPTDDWGTRSIPRVASRYPLWDDPDLARDVAAGRYYLPHTVTGRRETIVTSAVDARPQYVLVLPGPSWLPLLAAVGTAGFFLLLTVKLVAVAVAFGALAVVSLLAWLWAADPGPLRPPSDVGRGLRLPFYMTGLASHSWWAMALLLMVSGTLYANLAFGYFYTWTVSAGPWPPVETAARSWVWPLLSALGLALASVLVRFAGRRLAHRPNGAGAPTVGLLLAAYTATAAAVALAIADRWWAGLVAADSAYGALVYTLFGVVATHVAALTAMVLLLIARAAAGRLTGLRRASFDNVALFWHYTVAIGLLGLTIVHGFPVVAGG